MTHLSMGLPLFRQWEELLRIGDRELRPDAIIRSDPDIQDLSQSR
jgi:hypothetical protein